MQNEVIACYWKYKLSGNVGVDIFRRTKEKKNVHDLNKKKNLFISKVLFKIDLKFRNLENFNFICLIQLYELSKQVNLKVFQVLKTRNPNKGNPLNSSVYIYIYIYIFIYIYKGAYKQM